MAMGRPTATLADKWELAPHLDVLDEAIMDLVRGRTAGRVLLVKCPPRHGKSEYCSGWLPAWYLANFPDRRVMLTSYESDYACSWSRKVRQRYSGACIGRELGEKQTAAEWETTRGGGLVATGVGGAITGRGCHLLITDDLVKNAQQAQSEAYRETTWNWWRATAYTRLEPGGVCVVIGTPWHRDDVLARIERELKPTIVEFPAIGSDGAALWPQRYPLAELETIKKTLGAYWWNALYMLRPSQFEYAEWGDEYFTDDIWFDDWPAQHSMRLVALDPSLGKTDKADYSAFVMLAKGHDYCYYVDADIARRPSQKTVDDGVRLINRFKADAFGCETNQFQELLRTMFDRALEGQRIGTWGINNHLPKLVRLRLLTPFLANHRIRFKRNSPGASMLVEQLRDFPLGDYDDGPDALEMAIRLCEELLQGTGYEAPQDEVLFV